MARISAKRGLALAKTIQYLDPDDIPIDITGCTVTFTVTIGDDEYEFVDGDGLTITPDEGLIEVLIPVEAVNLWGHRGTWNLLIVTSNNVILVDKSGNLAVS